MFCSEWVFEFVLGKQGHVLMRLTTTLQCPSCKGSYSYQPKPARSIGKVTGKSNKSIWTNVLIALHDLWRDNNCQLCGAKSNMPPEARDRMVDDARKRAHPDFVREQVRRLYAKAFAEEKWAAYKKVCAALVENPRTGASGDDHPHQYADECYKQYEAAARAVPTEPQPRMH